jgi:threonine-phosphate decarboxylase
MERVTESAPLHGGQLRQIAARFGIPVADLLDFSANVNPDGPPASAVIALQQTIDEPAILMNYPDLEEMALRESLARYAGIRPENVAVANGFVPLLDAALRMLPIRTCLVPVPAFVEYRRTLERSRVELIPHYLTAESDFRLDLARLFDRSCDAILLANPQNPSGVLSSRDSLLRIVEWAAELKVHVLLDEAFIDFCPEASLANVADRFPNLIVFRSVTKFFGMAGLRVAYAVAGAERSKQIQEMVAPWSITSLASLAARVAVQDEAYVQRTIALNDTRRRNLRTLLGQLGIHVYPSAANFLLLRFPSSIDCRQLWERLIREYHVVLRNCSNYEGLDHCHLRVAVRGDDENRRLIAAVAREVAGRTADNRSSQKEMRAAS